MKGSEQESTKNVRRKLSAMERASLFMPNANVVMAACFDESVATESVREAIPALAIRHPLLSVKVEQDPAHDAWFVSRNVDLPPVEAGQGVDKEDWLRVVEAEHRRRLPLADGPLVRFRLIQDQDSTVCLITAHHAICDGISLVYVLRDLADWLRTGSFSEPSGRPVTVLEGAPRSSSPFMERTVMGMVNRKWRRKQIAYKETDAIRLHTRFWGEHRSSARAWTLSTEQTRRLISRCRDESVTVGNALNAAFLRAQSTYQAGRALNEQTLVAASFRHLLRPKAGAALGFYASGVRVPFTVENRASLWETARAFGETLKPMLNEDHLFGMLRLGLFPPTLIDALAFARGKMCDDRMVQSFLKKMGKDRIIAGLLMSNLGVAPITAEPRSPRIIGLYGPFVCSDTTEKYIGTSTVDGRLHLSLSFDETVVAPEVVEAVGNEAVRELSTLPPKGGASTRRDR